MQLLIIHHQLLKNLSGLSQGRINPESTKIGSAGTLTFSSAAITNDVDRPALEILSI
jgi:hypothetical protein